MDPVRMNVQLNRFPSPICLFFTLKDLLGREVTGVSYPYGEELAPVEGEGLENFQSFVMERGEKEEYIKLETRLIPGGMEAMVERENATEDVPPVDVVALRTAIGNLEYPELGKDGDEEVEKEESEMEKMLKLMTVEEKIEWFKANYRDPEE